MTNIEFESGNIFFPDMIKEVDKVTKFNIRFAHYTTAEAGIKILRSQKMILRNSALMNDFSEMRHGLECIRLASKSKLRNRLDEVLNKVQPNLQNIFKNNFKSKINIIEKETYILSVSEHGNNGNEEQENLFGRLSMWRAYAPNNGVAFVMNNKSFIVESHALGAYSFPVSYLMPEKFLNKYEKIVELMEKNVDLLKQLGGQKVHDILFVALRFAIQATKHPVFEEEKEWRLIYSPSVNLPSFQMRKEYLERMPAEILTINGVPQNVHSMLFKNYPKEGYVGATPVELIHRILIGPSSDSEFIRYAFVTELEALGISDAEDRVHVTGIPLRT